MNVLVERFKEEPIGRQSVLVCLTALISSATSLPSSKPSLLEEYKDTLLGILTSSLKEPDPNTRAGALSALEALFEKKDLVSEEEAAFVVHSINEVTFSTATADAEDEGSDANW